LQNALCGNAGRIGLDRRLTVWRLAFRPQLNSFAAVYWRLLLAGLVARHAELVASPSCRAAPDPIRAADAAWVAFDRVIRAATASRK
jgi:hypothetical protein